MRKLPNAVETEPFTSAVFDAMDAEIRSVFKADEMITSDEVRGNAGTLNEAVKAGGWPSQPIRSFSCEIPPMGITRRDAR